VRQPITLTRGAATAILLAVLCGGCNIVQDIQWATQPSVTCDSVPADLLETLVPGQSEMDASNGDDDRAHRWVECEWGTDEAAARRAHLVVRIDQYNDRLLKPGARDARRGYGWMKEGYVDAGPEPDPWLKDLDLGDDGYVFLQPSDQPGEGEVRVGSLAGGTVIEVSYTAAPSTESLRLAGAAAVVSALLKELR